MKLLILLFICTAGFIALAQENKDQNEQADEQTNSEKQEDSAETQLVNYSAQKNNVEQIDVKSNQENQNTQAAKQVQKLETQIVNSDHQKNAIEQPAPSESQQPDLAPVSTQDSSNVVDIYPFIEAKDAYNPVYPSQHSTMPSNDENSQYSSFFEEESPEQSHFSNKLSFGGHFLWGTTGSSNRFLNLSLNIDFGWVWNSVEVGPFLNIDTPRENLRQSYKFSNYTADIRFLIGLFGEFHFINHNKPHLKYSPSVGLKLGYGRAYNRNLVQAQPYLTLKYFASQRTALFASLAPYYTYKLDGGKEWGINFPIGLQLYF